MYGRNLGEGNLSKWKLHGLVLLIWSGNPLALSRVFFFFTYLFIFLDLYSLSMLIVMGRVKA